METRCRGFSLKIGKGGGVPRPGSTQQMRDESVVKKQQLTLLTFPPFPERAGSLVVGSTFLFLLAVQPMLKLTTHHYLLFAFFTYFSTPVCKHFFFFFESREFSEKIQQQNELGGVPTRPRHDRR